jgi:hypothetical protein
MSADFTLRDLAWVVAVRLLLRALRPILLTRWDPASFQHPGLPVELRRREVLRRGVGRLSAIRMEFQVLLRPAACD